MRRDHVNPNAKLPTLNEAVKFALAHKYSPRIIGLSVKESANLVLTTGAQTKSATTRAALDATDWPFTYEPASGIGNQSIFIIAVML